MDVKVVPTLIAMYRETFEGEVIPGQTWITDPKAGVFDSIQDLTAAQGFAPPADGARSIAAHLAHLRFALDLTHKRFLGENPPADWANSFNLPPESADAWEALKKNLRQAYDSVLAMLDEKKDLAPEDLPPIHLVGLSALIGHNAYHLGAIRQIRKVVLSQ